MWGAMKIVEEVSSESGREQGGAGGRAREGWELYSRRLARKESSEKRAFGGELPHAFFSLSQS